jgi:hypothetical protein
LLENAEAAFIVLNCNNLGEGLQSETAKWSGTSGNNARIGLRMRGDGVWSEQMEKMFRLAKRKAKLGDFPDLSTAHFRRRSSAQLEPDFVESPPHFFEAKKLI